MHDDVLDVTQDATLVDELGLEQHGSACDDAVGILLGDYQDSNAAASLESVEALCEKGETKNVSASVRIGWLAVRKCLRYYR